MSDRDMALSPRKKPNQARSRQTVEWILEAAARVFRREGFDATTNRIAEAAGVSIGTLYEYFPNKQSLLAALAARHVEVATRGIDEALAHEGPLPELLAALQSAIRASHRFPSQAIELVADPRLGKDLRTRASALRRRAMDALVARACAASLLDPEIRARTAFGLVAELTSTTSYEHDTFEDHEPMARHLLETAIAQLAARSGTT